MFDARCMCSIQDGCWYTNLGPLMMHWSSIKLLNSKYKIWFVILQGMFFKMILFKINYLCFLKVTIWFHSRNDWLLCFVQFHHSVSLSKHLVMIYNSNGLIRDGCSQMWHFQLGYISTGLFTHDVEIISGYCNEKIKLSKRKSLNL